MWVWKLTGSILCYWESCWQTLHLIEARIKHEVTKVTVQSTAVFTLPANAIGQC